jgi:hypothetical protein
MSKAPEPNWEPNSQLPLIAMLIDQMDVQTKEHFKLFAEAKDKPHVLDDETVDRAMRVHTESQTFVSIYDQQLTRWEALELTVDQQQEIDRLRALLPTIETELNELLALLQQLRKGTINRIMEMSDVELGLNFLLNNKRP